MARCSTARRATSPIAADRASGLAGRRELADRRSPGEHRHCESAPVQVVDHTGLVDHIRGQAAALGPHPGRERERPGHAGVAELLGHQPAHPVGGGVQPGLPAPDHGQQRGQLPRRGPRRHRRVEGSAGQQPPAHLGVLKGRQVLGAAGANGVHDRLADVGTVAGHHRAFQPQAGQGGVDLPPRWRPGGTAPGTP